MSKLHKEPNNEKFIPNEGQRGFLCNNKSSFRCPSLCLNESLSINTILSIEELGGVLTRIHKRLINEGYIIREGKIYKNEN